MLYSSTNNESSVFRFASVHVCRKFRKYTVCRLKAANSGRLILMKEWSCEAVKMCIEKLNTSAASFTGEFHNNHNIIINTSRYEMFSLHQAEDPWLIRLVCVLVLTSFHWPRRRREHFCELTGRISLSLVRCKQSKVRCTGADSYLCLCASLWFSSSRSFCSSLSHPVSPCLFMLFVSVSLSFTFSLCLCFYPQSAQIPLVSEHLQAGGSSYRLCGTVFLILSLLTGTYQIKNLN